MVCLPFSRTPGVITVCQWSIHKLFTAILPLLPMESVSGDNWELYCQALTFHICFSSNDLFPITTSHWYMPASGYWRPTLPRDHLPDTVRSEAKWFKDMAKHMVSTSVFSLSVILNHKPKHVNQGQEDWLFMRNIWPSIRSANTDSPNKSQRFS